MCGIVGYLGSEPYIEYIITGLKLLQNRGYDSAGISCINNGELITTKFASTNTNDSLVQTDCTSTIAIGHTRWATHGGKTNSNAHPHNDNKNCVSIVHNGIIENFQELKNNLKKEGYSFRSQTDTEVIAVLIGKYLDTNETMENAIKKTISELSGTWALVIIHKDLPNKIWVTRNGSPLLLGIDEEFIMVASEHIAFGNYIKKYIVLDNHDLIEITKDGQDILYNKNIHRYTIKEKSQSSIEALPSKYKHWMLKEIMEQPDAINRALNNGGRIENNVSVKLGGLDTCIKISN
jgi:glucosamine--fructose-6-phosphate aminotransferase (isomerizing)